MGTENALLQTFENVKPHIEAITKALKSYGLAETSIDFYKSSVEMSTFNQLGEVFTVTFTPAVEERVELTRGRVQG